MERLKPGDRVIGSCGHGGMADKPRDCGSQLYITMPATMPFDIASALVLTYGTSMHALKDRANIKPGATLLVLGAAGGAGAFRRSSSAKPSVARHCRGLFLGKGGPCPRARRRRRGGLSAGTVRQSGHQGLDRTCLSRRADQTVPTSSVIRWAATIRGGAARHRLGGTLAGGRLSRRHRAPAPQFDASGNPARSSASSGAALRGASPRPTPPILPS